MPAGGGETEDGEGGTGSEVNMIIQSDRLCTFFYLN